MSASLASPSTPAVRGKINDMNCRKSVAPDALVARSSIAARRRHRRCPSSPLVQPLPTQACSAARDQSDRTAILKSFACPPASKNDLRRSDNIGIDARTRRQRQRRRQQPPAVVVAASASPDGDKGGVAEAEGGTATSNGFSSKSSSNNNSNSSSSKNTECFGTGVEATCLVVDDDDGDDNSNKQRLASSSSASTSSSSSSSPPPSLLGSTFSTLLLISPFFFWGSSMAAMKLLEPHTTPLFVAAVRLLPAGAVLVAWAALKKRPFPKGPEAWAAIAVFALVDGAMFQGFLAEGLRRTSAGLGSVIIDSQPLTVAALSAVFYGEELTLLGVLGLVVGVAGLCLLEVPPETIAGFVPALGPALGVAASDAAAATAVSLSPTTATATAAAAVTEAAVSASSPSSSIWDSGEFWMLLAAQSMAAGTLLVPWVSKRADPVMATGFHMILGGVPLLALALAAGGGGIADGSGDAGELATKFSGITSADLALLAYVSLLGSAASYGVFFYNASSGDNLARLSSLTFLTPGFAVATGFVFLGETLTPLQLVGAGVTLAAVALISTKGKGSAEGAKEKKAE